MSFKISTLAALTLALAAFAQPAPASAAERLTRRSVTISYADLNLQSEAGAKALYKRIKQAARTTCGPMPIGTVVHYQPSLFWKHKDCIRGAVENAVASLNNPFVTALHNGQELPIRVAESVR